MKKIQNLIFSRVVITSTLIVLQLLLLIFAIVHLSDAFIYIYFIFLLFSIVMTLYIINRNVSASFKLPWILLILLVPLLGGILYFLFGHRYITKKEKEHWQQMMQRTKDYHQLDDAISQEVMQESPTIFEQMNYIQTFAYAPIHNDTKTKYYAMGEDMMDDLFHDLRQAKKFIFLEFFIVSEGEFFHQVLEILKEKVKEHVDVRLIYDDLGSITFLSSDFYQRMENLGIKCIPFNRFVPILSMIHNNRNHRKMIIIDGKISYTGGINLADEYINLYPKYGRWKDTVLRMEGSATNNLTLLFLESWDFHRAEKTTLQHFLYQGAKEPIKGYVQPFGDSPLDQEEIAKNVYMNLINGATKYIYINTPYFIVDFDMLDALCRSAKKGIDVRIMLPHIPDKWYVQLVSRSYYKTLIQAGVKVYEYRPGFNHAKSFVVDDEVAVIGSINLDYRSLVHHFECAVYLYQTDSVLDLKKDFLQTEKDGLLMKEDTFLQLPWYAQVFCSVLKIFAPLL